MAANEPFFGFLKEYADFLDTVVSEEKEKLEALLSFELKRIEQSISAGQAIAMQMDGYEKKRLALQRQAGLEGKTFRQIMEAADGESAAKLRNLFERIEHALLDIKFYSAKSMGLVKMGLQTTNQAVSSSGKSEPHGYTAFRTQTACAHNSADSFETKI